MSAVGLVRQVGPDGKSFYGKHKGGKITGNANRKQFIRPSYDSIGTNVSSSRKSIVSIHDIHDAETPKGPVGTFRNKFRRSRYGVGLQRPDLSGVLGLDLAGGGGMMPPGPSFGPPQEFKEEPGIKEEPFIKEEPQDPFIETPTGDRIEDPATGQMVGGQVFTPPPEMDFEEMERDPLVNPYMPQTPSVDIPQVSQASQTVFKETKEDATQTIDDFNTGMALMDADIQTENIPPLVQNELVSARDELAQMKDSFLRFMEYFNASSFETSGNMEMQRRMLEYQRDQLHIFQELVQAMAATQMGRDQAYIEHVRNLELEVRNRENQIQNIVNLQHTVNHFHVNWEQPRPSLLRQNETLAIENSEPLMIAPSGEFSMVVQPPPRASPSELGIVAAPLTGKRSRTNVSTSGKRKFEG